MATLKSLVQPAGLLAFQRLSSSTKAASFQTRFAAHRNFTAYHRNDSQRAQATWTPSEHPQSSDVNPSSAIVPVSSSSNLASAAAEFASKFAKPILASLVVASVLFCNPDLSLAAQGGGRVGGKSFSSSRMRSAPPPTTTYVQPSTTYIAPPVYSAPFFGGWGWGVPMFGPTVVVGGGGGFGIFGTLILAIAVFSLFTSISNMFAPAEEETWGEPKSSVVRLQVGLLGLARGLQKDLEGMALKADTTTPEGLHYLLQETVLALLRNPDKCVYAYSSSDVKRDSYEGEQRFNQLSMEERSKFREETLVNADGIQRRAERVPKEERFTSEYIVVTIIAATEDELTLPTIRSNQDLRTALTTLGSISVDQLQAVEILWTPQNDEDTLSAAELVADYPSLQML